MYISFHLSNSKRSVLSMTRCSERMTPSLALGGMSNYVRLCSRIPDGRWYSDDSLLHSIASAFREHPSPGMPRVCTGSRRHKAPSDIIEFLRCYRRKTKMSKTLPAAIRCETYLFAAIAKYRRIFLSGKKKVLGWLSNQRVGIFPCEIKKEIYKSSYTFKLMDLGMDHLILKFLDVEILESYEIFQVIFYKTVISLLFFF